MKCHLDSIRAHAESAVLRAGLDAQAAVIAENAMWLEAVSYPGLQLLAEALADPLRSLKLERDAIGFDLQNISCVFLAGQLHADVLANGRAFLRNVRHGLYLVKGSVDGNYGIGCPIDPGFALGGERTKNPYTEKYQLALQDGVEVADSTWVSLQ